MERLVRQKQTGFGRQGNKGLVEGGRWKLRSTYMHNSEHKIGIVSVTLSSSIYI
jgi:hypothetical protein